MQDHFNGLTPAEAERLAMLAEEAAKVVQVVGKILRHGYSGYHPDRPHISNRGLLMNELADLKAVQFLMEGSGDIFCMSDKIEHALAEHALVRKLTYTHHQGDCNVKVL